MRSVLGLLRIQGDGSRLLAADIHRTEGDGILELLGRDLQEMRRPLELVLVLDAGRVDVATRALAELQVAEMQYGRHEAEDVVDLVVREVEALHGLAHLGELVRVVDVIDLDAATAVEVLKVVRRREAELAAHSVVGTGQQLVEDVEVALALELVRDTRLLQQVVDGRRTTDAVVLVKVHRDQLAETRRVVVTQRLGVTERLENRVREQDVLLDTRGRTGDLGKEHQALLGCFGLSCTRLSTTHTHKIKPVSSVFFAVHHQSQGPCVPDKNRLILAHLHHATVGLLGNVEDVRGQRSLSLVRIIVNHTGRVQGQSLEWID